MGRGWAGYAGNKRRECTGCTRHGLETREKKRKTLGNGEKTDGQDKEHEERTRMLIGLKLNPTHLSLSELARSAPLCPPFISSRSVPWAGFGGIADKNRNEAPLHPLPPPNLYTRESDSWNGGPSFLQEGPFTPSPAGIAG